MNPDTLLLSLPNNHEVRGAHGLGKNGHHGLTCWTTLEALGTYFGGEMVCFLIWVPSLADHSVEEFPVRETSAPAASL